jgi:RNA polymerase sigma factor (sigma-70 family)
MVHFSDSALLNGLKNKDESVLRAFYRTFFPMTLALVERNCGTAEDAEDVFRDAMILLYERIRREPLRLSCTLRTYFYSICRHIWLKRLMRKQRLVLREEMTVQEDTTLYHEQNEKEDRETWLEMQRLVDEHFRRIPADCQRLLLLFFRRVPLREIAAELGYKGEEYAKSRKYMCKNMLRKRILADPACKLLFGYERT